MKKLFVLLIMLAAVSANAQSAKGKKYIGAQVSAGAAFPSGTVTSDMSSSVTYAYGAGCSFKYGLSESGMLLTEIGYEYRPIPLEYNSYAKGKGDYILKQSFVMIDIGWRILFNPLYLDLGLFYGIKAGTAKCSQTGDTSESGTIKEEDGVSLKNPFGLSCGAGFSVKASDKVIIDIGAIYKYSLTEQYEAAHWKLKSNTLSLVLGIDYQI
jgi:Outer membrane protein beta-barrel domain